MSKIIFYNGQVITVNAKDDIQEAVMICGGKIQRVGKSEEILELRDDDTKVIDLQGKTLIPGFIDAHCHIAVTYLIENDAFVDFFANQKNGVETISDIKNKVRAAAGKHDKGEWIIASFYNQNRLKEARHITRRELDEVAPDNPVVLIRECGHVGVLNTRAMLETGFFEKEKEYDQNHIFRYNDGEPNGVLKENVFMPIIKYVIENQDNDNILTWLSKISVRLSKLGITSIHEAGGFGTATFKHLQLANSKGMLNFRTYVMGGYFPFTTDAAKTDDCMHYSSYGFYSGFGNEMLKMGPAKLMLDGSSSGPSCSMKEPYSHDGNQFPTTMQPEAVEKALLYAHRNNFQFTSHAVGDRAVEMLLDTYENVLDQYPRENHRHRIEHCGFAAPDQIRRIRDMRLVPIANPVFINANGSDYIKYYGERVNDMFPQKSFLENDIVVAIGSDSPVANPDPIIGLRAMLTRKDGRSGEVAGEKQKIGILEAIRMATYNGAYASFEENIKGSIEEGKLADVVVLSKPLLGIGEEELKTVEVEITVFNGEIVWEKK